MKHQFFSITSLSYKIIGLILSIFLTSTTIAFIMFPNEIPWYVIPVFSLVSLALLLGTILFFIHGITIYPERKQIKIQTVKKQILSYNEINSISIDTEYSLDPCRYCFIVFALKNGEKIKISGFSSIVKKNGVKKSYEIVTRLKDIISKTSSPI